MTITTPAEYTAFTVEDMQSIEDPEKRARCEANALAMGRELLVGRERFSAMGGLCALARQIRIRGTSI